MFNLFRKPDKGMAVIRGIPNIIGEIFSRPSALCDSKLYELEAAIQDTVMKYQSYEDDDEEPIVLKPSMYEVVGDTAVIPIHGYILSEATLFEKKYFDVSSLKDVKEKIDTAMADTTIKSILIDMNSGGGGVSGVQVMSEYIAECNKTKKVYTFVNGLNCSAAYWLTAGTERMFVTPCSEIGSIGVICQLYDTSELYKKMGVKVHTIKTGKYKGQGFDGVEIDEEFIKQIQGTIDTIFGRFTAFVKQYRNIVDPDDAFQGQTFLDEDAIQRGFADYMVRNRSEIIR